MRKSWNKAYGFNKIYAGCHWSIRKQDAQYWHMLTASAMNARTVTCISGIREVV